MNKRTFFILVAIIAMVTGGVILNEKNHVKTPIKVGVILPLTGDFAAIGEELQKGVDLAIAQLHSKGVEISAVYEDDKFDPKEVVTAANKLITVDKVDFAVLFSVEEARPVVSIFNNSKVPLVVSWDSNHFLKDAGPYIFSNGFSTEKAGEIMADYAYSRLNLKSVAVLGHVDAWSEIISKSFVDEFKKDGGNIVYDEAVQVGTNDFRLQISKIKVKKPDGVYFPLIPFDSVSFIKQAKEGGLNVPLMSGDALIKDVIDAAGTASDNIYYTNAYSENAQLASIYKEKYGKDAPALVYTASGYDSIIKIGEQMVSSGNSKDVLDKVFGASRLADRVEKIYQVKGGLSGEVK